MNIIHDVRRIDGPITYMDIEGPNGNRVLLFGDAHTKWIDGCKNCKKPTCMTIIEVLDQLLKSKTYNVDVYLETPPFRVEKDNGESPLSVTERLLPARVEKSRYQNRLHWIDIREIRPAYNWLLLHDMHEAKNRCDTSVTKAIRFFLERHPSMEDWLAYIDVFIKDDYPSRHRPKYLKDSLPLTRYKRLRVHKIRKQLLKLDEDDRQRLIKFYEQMKQVIRDDYQKLFDQLSKEELASENKTGPSKYQKQKTILVIILFMSSLLMDVYGLARILYYLKYVNVDGRPHIAAIFAGDGHIDQYRRFFIEKLEWRPVFSRPFAGTPFRCIDV